MSTDPVRHADLLARARRHAAELAADRRIEAILVTGSVATGHVDADSDIDTILYFAQLPDAAEFAAIVAAAEATGGRLFGGTPEDGFALYRFDDGVRCDFSYSRAAEIDRLVDDFVAAPKVDDPTTLVLLRGLRDGIALHGAPRIAAWQARLADCPPALSDALVTAHAKLPTPWVLERYGVARGDRLFLVDTLLDAARRIIQLLYGLNGRWPTGKLKGFARHADELPLAPPNLAARLDALFALPPAEAVTAYAVLAGEVLDLLDAHRPGPAAAAARAAFGWRPPGGAG